MLVVVVSMVVAMAVAVERNDSWDGFVLVSFFVLVNWVSECFEANWTTMTMTMMTRTFA